MELLQQVRVIDPNQKLDRLADILIVEGKINAIAEQITDYPSPTQIFPGNNLILGTGLVDLYSHSGEPGNETRETLLDLAHGAAAGGFTQVGILPDTVPRIDNADIVAAITHKNQHFNRSEQQLSQLNFWGAISPGAAVKKMNQLGEMKSGVIGFSDQYNLVNLNLLKQVLEYVQPWQKPLAIALNQNELTGDGVVREGLASIRYGMSGNPSYSEAAIIAAVLEIVAEIPTPIHIMRVSTKRGVELIADAKARGVPVTASTTWMHLLWDSDSVESYDPNLRLDPPLGDRADQTALIEGLKQGIIDAIAIDHQAFTYEEKTVPFALAPPGVMGLELALPLLWQGLVASGKLSVLELWQALSSRPRRCLHQEPKAIAPEQVADLVLFDPQQTWLVNQDNLKSPAANTPYYNQQIQGKVIKTWISNQ
ncbi:dihydroorotase [Pleurocapsa sp. PCC 7319]|uniref:dihydroorotase n=1 Tax=Pleurocapsa sp. PCC 7319 TaxID=118161 RepID=UPI00034A2F67